MLRIRKKKAQTCKQQASVNTCHYKDLLEQDTTRQFEHSSDQTSKAKPATESDYSYAAVQGISEQLEQVGTNEAMYAEIKENKPDPYQLPTPATKTPPEPTEADNVHMYAAVSKKRNLPNTASEEMTDPPQAAQISISPAKPAPYKSKICCRGQLTQRILTQCK